MGSVKSKHKYEIDETEEESNEEYVSISSQIEASDSNIYIILSPLFRPTSHLIPNEVHSKASHDLSDLQNCEEQWESKS